MTTLALGAIAAGCGTDAAGDAAGPGDAPPPGTTAGTDPSPPGTDPADVDALPITMTHVLSGVDWRRGFADGAKGRIFAMEPTLSSSLARVTVATLHGERAEVHTLAAKGKIPTGRVEAFAHEPGSDLFVAIVRAMRPHRIEVVSVRLGAKEATFDTLAQPSPLTPDGSMFTDLYPKGGAGFLAVRGNELYTLTVGATATWSAPIAASGFYRGNSTSIMLDAKRGRLLGYGRDVYDPVTQTVSYDPSVGAMPLSGPYTWSELPLSSPPPAEDQQGWGEGWAALDAAGARLLAVVPMKDDCGGMPCSTPSLWSADLTQGTWTKLLDFYSPSGTPEPWATDDDGRRVFGHGDGQLWAASIASTTPSKETPLDQDGDLGPMNPAAAVLLASGKILSTDGGAFRLYDPAAGEPRWERFGEAKLSGQRRYRPSMTEDPTTGEVLLFGGAGSNANTPSQVLSVLSKDGASLEDEAASGAAPPARVAHGAAFVGRALVIAGGAVQGAANGALDDVWSFDRTSRAWKQIATLPKPLRFVSMRGPIKGSSEALAIGYANAAEDTDAALAPIVAIDVAAGKARELSSEGEAPKRLWSVAALGTCFVGYESGDTVDGTEPQLWRCKRDGDVVRWEKLPMDANDYALGGLAELRGVGAPDGSQAYFVGRTMWRAAPKK